MTRPAAETDDLAFDVADGEHDAVAEAVIAAALAINDKARSGERIGRVIGKNLFQWRTVGRIADVIAGSDGTGQSAPLQVVDRARRLLQLFFIELRSLFERVPQ